VPTFARGGRRHRQEFGVVTAAEQLASDRFFADLIGGPAGRGLPIEERDPLKSRLSFLYWDPSRGGFPGRPFGAPAGSAFMKTIAGKEAPTSWQRREDAIAKELINGNFPDFLVQWQAVAVGDGAGLKGRVWVMPDYLSIGNDQDWVYVPMSAPTAQRVADALKCVLPTAKLCHDIYKASSVQLPRIDRDYWREGRQRAARRFAPKDCSQVSTCAYEEHSDAIKKQMKGLEVKPGTFVAGHKKDVIIAANYPANRVAFQGFYKDGIPAEPCEEKGHKAGDPTCKRPGTPTFAHERIFADYAQGVRLVRAKMQVESESDLLNVSDVLAHERYHKLLSPEGRVVPARVPDVPVYD
jgi:hypothetical protein